ncbi:phospholipase D-like domain-containing protein [Croceicoccus hydrothermalis]|uniref:phospholipase D-like domain-containing protein n=1 Tax=Croceicoccus hydrothermalis TaxID=2867964 RepID=UPI001EFAB8D7
MSTPLDSPGDITRQEDLHATGEERASPAVWRYDRATRATVIVDAADYFQYMQQAMMNAKKRILLIGWDFDTRIALGRGRRWYQIFGRDRPPRRLGRFVVWLANRNPDLEIRVLKWDFGAIKMFFRGSMLADIWRWYRHDRIEFKFDSMHPFGCSHHQKIVVIDDTVAVCGGIDMTADRWDTRDHIDRDPRRRRPGGRRYPPWHDMTMMVEGDIVRALENLALTRWKLAGRHELLPVEAQSQTAWPNGLEPDFEDVELGVSRTRAPYEDIEEIREIEALFVELIGRAKNFIYAESQYFASRKIAEAICRRMQEDDPPEIVIVNPMSAEGWLEQQAMDTARARLIETIGRNDPGNRFRLYVPHTDKGTPIYVHAKLMIVDDEVLKIGSANMNNRSLGLDSECDLLLDTARAANRGQGDNIRKLRYSLLAEHLGIPEGEIGGLLEKYGSMRALIREHPQPGRSLRLFKLNKLTDVEKTLADEEWLDPESPADMFEPMSKRKGLFRRLRRPR